MSVKIPPCLGQKYNLCWKDVAISAEANVFMSHCWHLLFKRLYGKYDIYFWKFWQTLHKTIKQLSNLTGRTIMWSNLDNFSSQQFIIWRWIILVKFPPPLLIIWHADWWRNIINNKNNKTIIIHDIQGTLTSLFK